MKKIHITRIIIFLIILSIIIIIPCQALVPDYISSFQNSSSTFSGCTNTTTGTSTTLVKTATVGVPKFVFSLGSSATETKYINYPDAKFAVISDCHYYDNSLGTTGKAFDNCYKYERKLFKSSADLLNFAIKEILASNVKFVLVTGDLTKDGELVNHLLVAKALSKLTQKGIKVYVVPGNHDINNPCAFRYSGSKSIHIASISAAQFAKIYKSFGYGGAIVRDPSSLSYVAQPQKGLWIVALDSCRYSENKKGHVEVGGGRLTQKEGLWLEGVLKKAQSKGIAVMVMLHHGVVEHWNGERYDSNYLLANYKTIGEMLASYNVRLAFTGHYHAQDITRGDFGQYGSLYDIETGSLVTPPCAMRFCTLHGGTLTIRSESTLSKIYPGTNLEKDSIASLKSSIYNWAISSLKRSKVTGADAKYIANDMVAAFVAHYYGDENPALRPAFDENKLSIWARVVYLSEKYIMDGLWTDLPPSDNNCIIDLTKSKTVPQ